MNCKLALVFLLVTLMVACCESRGNYAKRQYYKRKMKIIAKALEFYAKQMRLTLKYFKTYGDEDFGHESYDSNEKFDRDQWTSLLNSARNMAQLMKTSQYTPANGDFENEED